MKLKVNDKEYEIKYGYRATAESGLIKQLVSFSKEKENEDDMDKTQDLLLWLPEFVLIGLQKFHKDEFGFDFKDEGEKEEKKDKVFDLLDDYFDNPDNDFMKLFLDLQNELMKNGFLSQMFQMEQNKIEEKKTQN